MLAFPAGWFLFPCTIRIEKMVAIPGTRRHLNFLVTKRGLQELLLGIIANSHTSLWRGFQDLLLSSSLFCDVIDARTHGGEAAPIVLADLPYDVAIQIVAIRIVGYIAASSCMACVAIVPLAGASH
jgi:hypothetical protein